MTRDRDTAGRRLWAPLLACAVLFAALHVATHDPVDAEGGPASCQVCHLNHAPGALLPPPQPVLHLFAVAFVMPGPALRVVSLAAHSPWQARAPPHA